MRVESRVDFLGVQGHAAIAELLSRARVFLQHSVTAPGGETEGLPSSIQEAMAAGSVVVSTRHAGIPEIVRDGENGWLVEEHEDQAYAQALIKVWRCVLESLRWRASTRGCCSGRWRQ